MSCIIGKVIAFETLNPFLGFATFNGFFQKLLKNGDKALRSLIVFYRVFERKAYTLIEPKIMLLF